MKKIETDIREYIRPMTKVVTLETLSDTMDEDWTLSAGDDVHVCRLVGIVGALVQ